MILGISGHPRGVGTARLLLQEALEEAGRAGGETTLVSVHEYAVTPCESWQWCTRGEGCVIPDDMWKVYPLIARCNALVIATPVFFGGPTGALKHWIDRCNPFWKDRAILKRNMCPTRPGALIATAGSTYKTAFNGTMEIAKSLFYSLRIRLEAQLLIDGLDDIEERAPTEDHRAQARKLGERIALLERAVESPFQPEYPWWEHPPDWDRRPC